MPVVVYGIRHTNLDDINECTDSYDSLYTNMKAAEIALDFAYKCGCTKCNPYASTMHTIVTIVVASEIEVLSEEDIDEYDEGHDDEWIQGKSGYQKMKQHRG